MKQESCSLRKHTLQQLMQDYEAVQHMFYEECLKLTENDLTREVFMKREKMRL